MAQELQEIGTFEEMAARAEQSRDPLSFESMAAAAETQKQKTVAERLQKKRFENRIEPCSHGLHTARPAHIGTYGRLTLERIGSAKQQVKG